MAHQTPNKQNEGTGMGTGMAAAAAAVVGVGVGIVGAVVLSDKSNREKIQDGFTKVKDQVTDTVEDKMAEGKDKAHQVGDAMGDVEKKVTNILQK